MRSGYVILRQCNYYILFHCNRCTIKLLSIIKLMHKILINTFVGFWVFQKMFSVFCNFRESIKNNRSLFSSSPFLRLIVLSLWWTIGPYFAPAESVMQSGFASFVPVHSSFSHHAHMFSKWERILCSFPTRSNVFFKIQCSWAYCGWIAILRQLNDIVLLTKNVIKLYFIDAF